MTLNNSRLHRTRRPRRRTSGMEADLPVNPTCPGRAERDRCVAELERRNGELEGRVAALEALAEQLRRGDKR